MHAIWETFYPLKDVGTKYMVKCTIYTCIIKFENHMWVH